MAECPLRVVSGHSQTSAFGQKATLLVHCEKLAGMSEKSNSQADYIYVWAFIVSESSALEFEECYGPDGDWARLFRKSTGYLKTELFRDKTDPLRYLTIDHWQSEKDYSKFLATFKAEYGELDRRYEALTAQETKIGTFTKVS